MVFFIFFLFVIKYIGEGGIMKIIKLRKKGKGRYQIIFDNDEELVLYEEIMIKHNLFLNNIIDYNILSKIKEDNQYLEIYNQALKYISIRLRSKKEMINYLKKKNYQGELIDSIISQLIHQGYLDDASFAEAFINDRFKFSNDGLYKIKKKLQVHEIDQIIIDQLIKKIDQKEIDKKIKKIIDKRIKLKSKDSNYKLKTKLFIYLFNLGYDRQLILKHLDKINNKGT